jgi:hypothetical protein
MSSSRRKPSPILICSSQRRFRLRSRFLLGLAFVCSLVLGLQFASAQTVTTSTIAGVVMDAQKAVVPGVTVTATHVPTGTTYQAITRTDGRFIMAGIRAGGPYTVTATMSGFKTAEQSGIEVGLGETRQVEIALQVAQIAETVTVVAETQQIDTARAGTAANLGAQAVEQLPTISRSLFDIARTSPYVNTNADNLGSISVAGRNNRYNNMQIDGAVNNDVFGLASSGTPGGQTGTQPISLDAIQEVQLVVSPYDVRQGGFSGGGLNAVTKSGTNSFHGTAYYFMRNQDWVRSIPAVKTVANPNPSDVAFGTFTDKQVGFAVGGPVVKDKLFFFTNFDWARKSSPAGYSLDGSSGQTWPDAALVPAILNIAKTKYNFDAGGLGEVTRPNNSNKVFARGDYNLSKSNQLTFRTNYVDALAIIGSQSSSTYKMPGNFYNMTDKMLSNVAQLNSSFGSLFNELRVTYQRERNIRGDQPGSTTFPEIRVDMPSGNYIYFGSEYSSHANKLNQDIVEVTDDLTLVKGSHTLSLGTHNEFYKFYNLFIQNLYGRYRFSNADNFAAGIAQAYDHSFSKTSNPLEAARFNVRQFGVYAGDQWHVKRNFMLTYGLRIDLPRFPDKPHANPLTVQDFGYGTDVVPGPTMWSPRAGFNWDISGNSSRKSQIRGGLGIFTGRTPYVWLSNQYGNTGVDFTSLSATYNANNKIPFIADPNAQPTTVPGSTTGKQTVNLIDPNYKFPMIFRTNIGWDHDLWNGFTGTAEFVYTKNLKEIAYRNINYVSTGTATNGRTMYKKFDNNLNDAMLLMNTSAGRTWSLSYKVDRRFSRFFTSASYLYGRADSINDGTSSVARSNWANNPIGVDANNPSLTRSYYDIGHRINISASVPAKLIAGLQSNTSVAMNFQSGRPYTLGFNGDMNGDAALYNDLLYVPATASDVIVYSSVASQTPSYDALMAFLDNTAAKDYHGQIMPRNAGSTPWFKSVDFRFALSRPLFKERTKVEITLDVFNLLNLLNKNWGWQYAGGFPASTSIGWGGVDTATGKMKYNLNTILTSTFQGIFTRDDTLSRAQAQLGLRFRF